ncbi:hypothetical protein DPEC_G00121520 [Dallia pectoralis]|uniref:Uncharacterized protein n=1 Tax=Dallia pectoralis TaxID=75939 RepID=A0ACC2GQ04_DALPE|nr:hypothetical protein DPEC_G00121520 [Dallia pectoralis]
MTAAYSEGLIVYRSSEGWTEVDQGGPGNANPSGARVSSQGTTAQRPLPHGTKLTGTSCFGGRGFRLARGVAVLQRPTDD